MAPSRKRKSPRRTVFFDGNSELSLLCNADPMPVAADGFRFLTAEHAVQHHKVRCAADAAADSGDGLRSDELRRYLPLFCGDTAMRDLQQIKQLGSAIRLRPNEMSEWHARSVDYQTRVCLYKFVQSPDVRRALRSTGDALLVKRCPMASADCFWGGYEGAGGEIKGLNKLGGIWTRIRDNFA